MSVAKSPMPDTVSTFSMLAIGFTLGLKHAIEADHLAAVTTIVSQRKSTIGAALVGTVWGIGHSVSLVVAGLLVLFLRIEIAEHTAQALEFGVAIMLIGLGANVLWKVARGGRVHAHVHTHGGVEHAHPHVHEKAGAPGRADHHGLRILARPLVVGMMHGMAGSAALMLLVLSTVTSPVVGLAYIGLFGAGSIAGMTLMSALVSLPMRLTATRFAHADRAMQCLAGLFGVSFGLYLAYRIGVVDGLFVQ